MKRLLCLCSMLAAAACGVEGQVSQLPGDHSLAVDEASSGQAVTCAPLMNTFPIAAPHNIGYDAASCGSGTCAIACPDPNANSDWGNGHHGIDLFAYFRAPVVAVVDGTIVRAGWFSSTSGNRIRLRDACGWEYWYGHLDEIVVAEGQAVNAGDLIGYMGHTGTASTHTHFNVDPDGNWYNDINPFDLLVATEHTACEQGGGGGGGGGTGGGGGQPGCGALAVDGTLGADQSVASCDGRFQLVMQSDGNLVLYLGGTPLWDSGTAGSAAQTLVMQSDGNLVTYSAGGQPVWSSHTYGKPGATLAVQDDGNLVIYGAAGGALWSSGTCCH